MLLFAWMEGEQVCLGPAELCWKQCGYVLCGGIRYEMLAFPLENHKWMLGALCEQLYRSCVPFQLFLYRGARRRRSASGSGTWHVRVRKVWCMR